MKKIAAIFLLLFMLIQVCPAIDAVFEKSNTFFVMDQDKGDDNADNSLKDKKDLFSYIQITGIIFRNTNITVRLSEKIHPTPYLEQHTPPPNFG